ncbi:MAG: taurine ABC transporter substrate-binding protein [Desulfofustis sp. PB-SRB1]|jgi:taurine transport system substrate-binding protein|nr:taurine ABC transporter substrate-binding protein [Desulfofustis sp. PB-SRB1]MBM1003317.1 taurine ABC transporter substrate-binding protein [Desulfofustis sp. PB-SRB1]
MKMKGLKLVLSSLVVYSAMTLSVNAADKVIIATFGEALPVQMAAHEGTLAEATGWNIDWRKFGSGTDVIAAMASGDVALAELGSSPFAIGATQGVDIEAFMLDFVIGESESLIVRNGAGIESLADLKGKRVATPLGSTAHFSLMGALNHAGVAENELTIMGMSPDQITAAWQQEAIDAAFVWPPAQTEILKTGKRLVGADKVAEWGYPTFNVWVVNKEFAAANKDSLVAFMKAVDAANLDYLENMEAWTADSPQVKAIAAQTGATPETVVVSLKGYKFLPLTEQLKPTWMGGGIAKAVKDTAAFLKSAGRIDQAADDYSNSVNIEYLKAAIK